MGELRKRLVVFGLGCLALLGFSAFWMGALRAGDGGESSPDAQAAAIAQKIADDAPRPLSVPEALKAFSLPEGFEIREVASEPLIADPVSITFDARGRLFVVELYGYNLEGQLDVDELNKQGIVDRQVRRFHVDEALAQKAQKQIFSRVKRLEDRDGDGVMDHATIWADRLPPCHGIVAAGEKIIVVCAPDVVSLEDTDDDGQADHRETIFTGFGVGELWTRINSPRWGIDNWIYVGAGQRCGGLISGPHLKTPVKLGNTSFRFKPDGSAIEPAVGTASGYGHTFNDWGHRFALTNQQHAMAVSPIEPRYARRNPYLILPRADQNISTYGHPAELFPLSQPHPWRTIRASDPGYVKLYGASETTAGLVTSACSPVIYRADQFPEEYYGVHFSCEPAQNLVHACRLVPHGLSYRAQRLFPDREFLASSDAWFRPVNLVQGPDGALYLADMYREIIEDYSAVPRYLQQRYGLMNGSDRGRIWRIAAKSPAAKKLAPVATLDASGLVETLRDANAWRREQAQYLLVSGHDSRAIEPLRTMATQDKLPTARVHALYTLDGLGQLDEETLLKSLVDVSPPVRATAVRLAESKLDGSERLRERIVSMIRDDDAHVRLQSLLSLGQCSQPEVIREVGRSVLDAGEDDLIVIAAFCRPPQDVQILLTDLLSRDAGSAAAPMRGRLVRSASRIVAAERDAQPIADVLQSLSQWNGNTSVVVEGLHGIIDGLGKSRLQPAPSKLLELQQPLAKLSTFESPQVRRLTRRLMAALGVADLSNSREAQEVLAKTVLDENSSLEDRVAALESLSGGDGELLAQVAEEALKIHQPMSLQQAVIDALDRRGDLSGITLALARWSDYTPSVQNSALEMAFRRADRLPGLLDAIEEGQVPARMLAGVYRERLLEHADAKIQSRAKKLLTAQSEAAESDERLERFSKALDAPSNAGDGAALFKKNCAICHRLAGEGGAVGPDLSAVNKQPAESILKDILRPSEKITAGFLAYLAETEDGQVFIGIVTSESDNSITLQLASGQSTTLLRKQLADLKPLKQSLMPDNFSEVLTPQEAAAIIGYLQSRPEAKHAVKN